MVPNLFRMLALASAVLIGSGYIWWASERKPVDPGGAAVEAIAGANPNEEDVNPNAPIPTTIMLSSKRIEMPVFSSRRGLLPEQEIAPETEWSGEFEGFINYGEPILLDPFLSEPIKTAIDPPAQKEEADEMENNLPPIDEATEPGSILAPDTLGTGPEATPQQP